MLFQKTKLGIYGFYPKLIGKIDFFEVSLPLPLLTIKKIRERQRSTTKPFSIHFLANHFYYQKNLKYTLREKIELLLEHCENTQANLCTLKITPRAFLETALEEDLSVLLQLWKKNTSLTLNIELPAELPRVLAIKKHDVIDPFWHSRLIKKADQWKIHGWHESRWIRMYSEEQLLWLLKKSKKEKPTSILFAHSQRETQISQFIKLSQTACEEGLSFIS